MNTNENSVVALFPNQAAADAAIDHLLKWDKNSKDVKLGAIGKVTLENGEIKADVVHGGIFKKSLHLDDQIVAACTEHLDDEKVVVVVRSDDYEVSLVRSNLQMTGGDLPQFIDPYTSDERADEAEAGEDATNIHTFDKGMDDIIDVTAYNKTGFN